MSNDEEGFKKVITKIIETIKKVYENEYHDDDTVMFDKILTKFDITDVNYGSVKYEEVGQPEKEQINKMLSHYKYSETDAATNYINLILNIIEREKRTHFDLAAEGAKQTTELRKRLEKQDRKTSEAWQQKMKKERAARAEREEAAPATEEKYLAKLEGAEEEAPVGSEEVEAVINRHQAAANAAELTLRIGKSSVSGITKRLLPYLVKQVRDGSKQMRQPILVAIKKLANLVKAGAALEDIEEGERVLRELYERQQLEQRRKLAQVAAPPAAPPFPPPPRRRWAYQRDAVPLPFSVAPPTPPPHSTSGGGTLKRRKPKKKFSRKNIIKLLETQRGN